MTPLSARIGVPPAVSAMCTRAALRAEDCTLSPVLTRCASNGPSGGAIAGGTESIWIPGAAISEAAR